MRAREFSNLCLHRLDDASVSMASVAVEYLAFEVQPTLPLLIMKPSAFATCDAYRVGVSLRGPSVHHMVSLALLYVAHDDLKALADCRARSDERVGHGPWSMVGRSPKHLGLWGVVVIETPDEVMNLVSAYDLSR